MTGSSRSRARIATVAAAVLTLTLSACGGGAAPPAPPAAPPAAGDTAAEESARTGEFCSADVDLESALNSGPPIEALPPEAVEGVVAQMRATLDPLLTRVEDLAPEEVTADVTTLATTTRQALSTMDFAAFETPEFAAAEDRVDTWLLDNCGFEEVAVTATDFEYQGVPDTLPVGEKAVTLTNEGTNFHEIVILRVNDGVTMPAEELLALPMEEALAQVAIKGITFADPGGSDTSFMRFDEPGRYLATCFIPEGTTMDHEGTGPPHFVLGMLGEVTVA